MSVAPEIARLAETSPFVPPQAAARPDPDRPDSGQPDSGQPDVPGTRLTLGTLARRLRLIAATPERWWGLVRFEPDRPVNIDIEAHPGYQAWLMVLPPGHRGQPCDCDVVTMIAGEATEGTDTGPTLRPGPLRAHGQPHRLRGRGTGYSISLHARFLAPEPLRETTLRLPLPRRLQAHRSRASCLDWATRVPFASQISKSSSW
ncbi:MAG: hypothetical protein ABSB76_33100 [Streptosporangiaceae bacterium]|jgi:hypothetical protein